jgi:hypothetical protein
MRVDVKILRYMRGLVRILRYMRGSEARISE